MDKDERIRALEAKRREGVRKCWEICCNNAASAEKSGARSIAQAYRTAAADIRAAFPDCFEETDHD